VREDRSVNVGWDIDEVVKWMWDEDSGTMWPAGGEAVLLLAKRGYRWRRTPLSGAPSLAG